MKPIKIRVDTYSQTGKWYLDYELESNKLQIWDNQEIQKLIESKCHSAIDMSYTYRVTYTDDIEEKDALNMRLVVKN